MRSSHAMSAAASVSFIANSARHSLNIWEVFTHGVNRFICQTTLGAGDSYGNLNFFWKHIMFGMLLRPAMADHNLQEDYIRSSDIDWTIVRPAAFTDGTLSRKYQHGFSGKSPKGLALKISRADVAHFMLEQLKSNTYLRQTPGLSY